MSSLVSASSIALALLNTLYFSDDPPIYSYNQEKKKRLHNKRTTTKLIGSTTTYISADSNNLLKHTDYRLTNFSFRQKLYAYVWWVERTYRTVCMVRNKICVFHNVIAIIFIAVVYIDIQRTTNTFSRSRKTTHTPTNMQKENTYHLLVVTFLWGIVSLLHNSPSLVLNKPFSCICNCLSMYELVWLSLNFTIPTRGNIRLSFSLTHILFHYVYVWLS